MLSYLIHFFDFAVNLTTTFLSCHIIQVISILLLINVQCTLAVAPFSLSGNVIGCKGSFWLDNVGMMTYIAD
jgi:hypothetical protein